jgi:hypothetical protein
VTSKTAVLNRYLLLRQQGNICNQPIKKDPMEKIYKNCQSCGMPLKKDEKGGGTNKDGSKSKVFCSKCYENGEFTAPDRTVNEMQLLVKGKLKELGFPGFIAGLFTKGIPKLQRWKQGSI